MQILEFIFSSPWRFLGIVILMFIPASWRLINVDVTLLAMKPDDMNRLGDDND